jgi:ABC-type transport system involved in multi-copper enzyme maturation permease subunit
VTAIALSPAAPQSRAGGVFGALVQKECAEQILSSRFVFGAVLSLLLCSLAATIRSQEYIRANHEESEYNQRWLASIYEQVQRDESVQVDGVRTLPPLAVLSTGLEPLTPVRFSCTKEGLRFGEGRAAKTPTDALFGQLDLAFVVGTLLSLLAIVLTFDSVTRERDEGTLSLVLSYPIRRPLLIAAKITAAIGSLTLCLLPSIAISLLISMAFGMPVGPIARWAAFFAASVAYLLVFTAAGVLISASVKQSSHAAVIAVFAWALPVFAAPRIISLIVVAVEPPTQENRIALKQEALISEAKVAFAAAQTEAFRAYLASGNETQGREQLNNAMKSAAVDLRKRRLDIERRMWDDIQREQNRRMAAAELLSYITPTALYTASVADFAATGSLQRRLFYSAAHHYYEDFGAPLAESRHVVFARVPGAATDRALVQKADLRPYLHRFSTPWVSTSETFLAALPRLVAVLAFAAICYVVACGALLRADVRRP